MAYRVKLTNYAITLLGNTVGYISKELCEPETAKAWRDRIKAKIASLDEFPQRFPLVDAEPWRANGIHKMPIENFIVYFWIDEDTMTVWVTAVVYGMRNQTAALGRMPMKD